MQSSGPSYFRSQNRNAEFLLVLTAQPRASQRGELKWKEERSLTRVDRTRLVKAFPPRDSGGNRQRLPERPPERPRPGQGTRRQQQPQVAPLLPPRSKGSGKAQRGTK